MKLAEFKKQQNLTDEALAALIGDCTVSGLRKWIAGDRMPRPDQMKRIVSATGGAVMPNDFYDAATEISIAGAAS